MVAGADVFRHRIGRPVASGSVGLQRLINVDLPGTGNDVCRSLGRHGSGLIVIRLRDKAGAGINVPHMFSAVVAPISRRPGVSASG